jgi:hypothetical protein
MSTLVAGAFETVQQEVERELEFELVVAARTDD